MQIGRGDRCALCVMAHHSMHIHGIAACPMHRLACIHLQQKHAHPMLTILQSRHHACPPRLLSPLLSSPLCVVHVHPICASPNKQTHAHAHGAESSLSWSNISSTCIVIPRHRHPARYACPRHHKVNIAAAHTTHIRSHKQQTPTNAMPYHT